MVIVTVRYLHNHLSCLATKYQIAFCRQYSCKNGSNGIFHAFRSLSLGVLVSHQIFIDSAKAIVVSKRYEVVLMLKNSNLKLPRTEIY